MEVLLYIAITIATFAFMEFVAWFTHKYLMHGLLWSWHEDHHKPKYEKEGFFEKNDRFFMVFAIPSALCYIAGTLASSWLLFVGIGISLYGLAYFLIHDVFIHKRFKWFEDKENRYARAITRAHGAHHARTTKDGGESFGLLVVPARFFRKNRRKDSHSSV